uniref:Ion transport domain-containing protein n=1 Tax=Alexandrium catenella TaxID=2925 RepID=A0A7S1WD12_ALECA
MIMEWATRLFWTIDMVWSSFTAVVLEDGTVEFSHMYILKRYAKSWLLLDIVINGVDWAMTVLSSSGAEFISLARIFRIVRVMRLLRLVRMQELLTTITERIQSDKLSLLLSVVKIVVFVLSTSHLVACVWWGIGARTTSGQTWVKGSRYDNAGLTQKYLASLHWSLAQFTGGMDEITPEDPLERFYASLVWVFAFVASAIIVSTLTSNLTQLHIIGGARARQIATLRKYLTQNSVSSNLALRVQRSAQHAVNGEIQQESVELLAVVSEPLKIEMHFAMYTSVARTHPFFADFVHEAPTVMRRICHYAMSTMLLIAGDVIFTRGEELDDPKMFWVWKGSVTYVNPYSEPLTLKDKQWIAEPALWTRWRHRGTLTATNDAKLVCLDAKSFQDISTRHKYDEGFDPKLFAADFVENLNQTAGVDDLTSLCVRP